MISKELVERLQKVVEYLQIVQDDDINVTVYIISKDLAKGFMRDLNIIVMKAEKKIRAIEKIKKESKFEA